MALVIRITPWWSNYSFFIVQPLSTTLSTWIHEQQVQQQIVKAQRNGMSAHLIQDCENRLTFTLILASAASVQHVGPTVVAAVTALRTQNSQGSRPSGPLVQLPGFPMPLAPSLWPQTVSANPPGVASGYNLNHIGYQATRANIASNAYAGNSGQIVLIEVRAVCLPEGKLKPILIGVSFSNDPSTQEPSSNVNIGPAHSCSQHSTLLWTITDEHEHESFYLTQVTPDQFLSWIRRSSDNVLPDSIPHFA